MIWKQHGENCKWKHIRGNKPQDNKPPETPRQQTLKRKYKGILAATDSRQGINIQFPAREYLFLLQ